MRSIIIGGGIIGLAISYHLTKRGCSVTIIDETMPSGRASAASFACLNFFNYWKEPYFSFRRDGIEALRVLALELSAGDVVHLPGVIRWANSSEGARKLLESVDKLNALGVAVESLSTSELARIEPNLMVEGASHGIFRVPGEGWVDPYILLALLQNSLVGNSGATVEHARVTDIEERHDQIAVITSNAVYEGDVVCISAGEGTSRLAAIVGTDIPLTAEAGVMAVIAPIRSSLRHVVYGGSIHFRPDGGGRIIAGHHGGPIPDGIPPEEESKLIAKETSRWLPAIHNASDVQAIVGFRPIPADGYPIAGFASRSDRVYLAVSHSGFTVGVHLAALVAQEMVGEMSPALERFRPSRFLS